MTWLWTKSCSWAKTRDMAHAWLTPDSIPAGILRRALFLPDDLPWLQNLYGAIDLMGDPDNWESYGSLTPDQTAAVYRQVLLDLVNRKGHVLDVGDVFFSAAAATPSDCLACDGSQVAQIDYPALYAALGSAFGAADPGYFRLPDLQARSPIGTSGTLSRGDAGGNEEITLTVDQLPAHDHSLTDHSHTILTGLPGVALTPGELPVQLPEATPGSTGLAGGGSTGSTGSGEAVNIRNPYLVLKAWIVAF